ncbi:hypothetical protein IVA88_16190 [Bradyrhizobium sp. 149]|uniref:dimethylarginine dimethylaminohydrolase family protein n=1 Tax=Bradyrhizobium sp. 149 TaxID=2782624 RepID=UPI001FF957A6|nr:arginine deiminase family protein [Bradyrhizobium sp. 149]MCK1652963.1 hypothetical protein [Bradyrhizobium sp. 149]
MRTEYCDSEYGRLREALLCPPAEVSSGGGDQRTIPNHSIAKEQHEELVRTLVNEGIECHLMPADHGSPYQCYTRDSCVMTPWGLLQTRMGIMARQGEPRVATNYAGSLGIPLWKRITRGTLEGGDVQILRPGLVIVGYNGLRTTEDAAWQVKSWFEEKAWTCRIVRYHRSLRHIDLAIGVLSESSLVCCREMVEAKELAWLMNEGYTLHDAPAEECLRMGCNILNIGGGRVIAHALNERSNRLLHDLGLRVIEVNVSEFVADFGGIHCLVQAVRRDLN